MFSRQRAAISSRRAIGRRHRCRTRPAAAKSMAFLANLRIEMQGPSSASGGKMMLTRLPSGRRASTIGLNSSMRRPTAAAMCWRDVGQVLRRRGSARRTARACRAARRRPCRAVDHDVGDRLVLEQRLQRAEAEHVVDQLERELPLFARSSIAAAVRSPSRPAGARPRRPGGRAPWWRRWPGRCGRGRARAIRLAARRRRRLAARRARPVRPAPAPGA